MSILQRVDNLLKDQLTQGPLSGTHIPVTFDTPDQQWTARRSGPCVNVFLHTVEEDTTRRGTGTVSIVDEDGTVVGYQNPDRHFTLAYLITVWAQTVSDEHHLLGRLLQWCAATEELTLPPPPHDTAPGARHHITVRLRGNSGSPSEESSGTRIWSTLGTPARPALELTLTVPLPQQPTPASPAPAHGATLRAAQFPARHQTAATQPPRRPARPQRRVEEVE
ncbi:DUF4255 domain-containing protein [Streptomyces klenkii]|uniref:DUF4255 domain-containing protein n=1 Tax=Streptomyces klenkii TaxID=1420899 RepID=UPI0033A8EE4C